MINGMTGFGSAQISTDTVKIYLEIKSVNHRYFDISFYLPMGFASLENKIRQVVQKHMERGRINLSLKITHKSSHTIHVNKEVAKTYLKQARQLSKEFGVQDNLTLSDIVKLPGVFEHKESVLDLELLWPNIEKCLLLALKSVVTMRKREGKALHSDITSLLGRMLLKIKEIKKRSVLVLKEKKKQVPAEEFKSYQKSIDINEELTRLSHYIDEAKLLLKGETEVGKKIDFIAQEMQRETNTIGSKLQDKIVSNAVIALKSKIEKIRELAQNIE
jgi:uncharacterized protein (TIGR00255 family)